MIGLRATYGVQLTMTKGLPVSIVKQHPEPKKPKRPARKRTSNGQRPLPRIDVTTMYDTLTLEEWKKLRS
tara:strand:- start:548 stop:757 length:210 start_codon:yes stop_codon:yes gene_type:complete